MAKATASISGLFVIDGLFIAFAAALRFLTRLPMPSPKPSAGGTDDKPMHPWTMAMFPVVGLLLGAVLWSVSALLGALLPQGPLDLLLLALVALLSGAIHWDGLIDTADALGVPKARRLGVLRDVHAGSFGVLAAIFVVLLQWSSLSSMDGWFHGAALLLFPLWGRWLMLAVSCRMADARQGQGLAGAFLDSLTARQVAASGAFSLLVSVLLLGLLGGLMLLSVMGLLAIVLRRGYQTWFGGVTGDPIGAACCLGEGFALLVLAALA